MLKNFFTAALILIECSFHSSADGVLDPERERICEHFNTQGPKPGELAPDFTLEESRGLTIRASELWAKKPVVVITGSYSCPMFRENTPFRKGLIREFGAQVVFVVVYTQEAHPNDALGPYSSKPVVTKRNEEEGVSVPSAKTFRERYIQARKCRDLLDMDSHVVIDTMDNAVWTAFGGSPNCAYLIGTDGKILLQQGLSDPAAMRVALKKLLAR